MEKNELQTELDYFASKKEEWLPLYDQKFLLIKGKELIGSFDTSEAAYQAGLAKLGNVPFLIKQLLKVEPTVISSEIFTGVTNAYL